jgi:AcrR family transcriptional regulator
MSERTKIGRRRIANAKESSEFYQDRRKEIFQKAAEIFLAKGYEAATINDIAVSLGTDRATLYYYVGSKKELFQHVVREAAQKSIDDIEALANTKIPAVKKLQLAFTGLMENYCNSFPYLHVFLQENFQSLSNERDSWDKESRGWSARYYKAMRKILENGVQDGEFSLPLPIGLSTMAVIGAINWAHRWYRPGGQLGPDQIGAGFADILLNGLLVKRKRKQNP